MVAPLSVEARVAMTALLSAALVVRVGVAEAAGVDEDDEEDDDEEDDDDDDEDEDDETVPPPLPPPPPPPPPQAVTAVASTSRATAVPARDFG